MNDQQKHVITVVDNCDDWVGVYIDGTIVAQGHDAGSVSDVLRIGERHQPYTVETVEPDPEWLYRVGHLPSQLSDVQTA